MIIIFLGFLLRIILAINNIYLGGIPGAGLDFTAFHIEAITYSNFIDENGIFNLNNEGFDYRIGWYYSVFLGFVYNIFGESLFLGSFISCLVWLISALIFRNILLKIKTNKNLISPALFIYTFIFPTTIVYTSVTLREVYMLCFVNLILLIFINILNTKKNFSISNISNIFFIIVIIFLFMILHRANIITSVAVLGLCFFYYFIIKLRLRLGFVVMLGLVSLFFLEYLGIIELLFERILSYQSGHFKDTSRYRASYFEKDDIILTTYSLLNFVTHVSKNIINYLIQPSILRISNMMDFVLLFENIARITIIIIAISRFFKKFDNKAIFNIVLLSLLVMEAVYAQSTVNWGTAARHHVQSMGLYLILFFFPNRNFFTFK